MLNQSYEAAKRKAKRDIGWGLFNIVNPFFRNGGIVRPKARGGTWSDKVRLTDKGLEGQSGANYYYDADGNIVNATTGRKGHIALDEVEVTPASGTITEKEQKDSLAKQGYYYHQTKNKIKGLKDKYVARNPNTSSTSAKSTNLENRMYSFLDGDRNLNRYRTSMFDIPYGDRSIRVQIGNAVSKDIPINALDSVAKYAGRTNTSIPAMLGLPEQETGWGERPYFNYGNLPSGFSSTDLGNANYFKAFGTIPQENLVRDFRYNDDINNGKNPISISIPPLQHAFEYFNSGNYNRGDKNHTRDVINAGNALLNESTGNLRKWWNTEGKYWYNKGKQK